MLDKASRTVVTARTLSVILVDTLSSQTMVVQMPARHGLPVLLENTLPHTLPQAIQIAPLVVLMNMPALALVRNVRPRLYYLAPLAKDLRTEG